MLFQYLFVIICNLLIPYNAKVEKEKSGALQSQLK